jgi:hypothetical protein
MGSNNIRIKLKKRKTFVGWYGRANQRSDADEMYGSSILILA